jgi:esterase/lipase
MDVYLHHKHDLHPKYLGHDVNRYHIIQSTTFSWELRIFESIDHVVCSFEKAFFSILERIDFLVPILAK